MKRSPGPQSNTILNYFSRNSSTTTSRPAPPLTTNDNDSVDNKVIQVKNDKTPLKAVNSITPHRSLSKSIGSCEKTPKTNHKPLASSTPNSVSCKPAKVAKLSQPKSNTGYSLFDLVWAKLDGYPWWPAIVCNDPAKKCHELSHQIHVQFFDDPISHSWVRKRDVKPYTGFIQPGISVKSNDAKLKSAIEKAEEVFDVSIEDRSKFIGDLHTEEYQNLESDNSDPNNRKGIFLSTPKRKISTARDNSDEDNTDEETVPRDKRKSVTQRKRFKRIAYSSSEEDVSEEDEEYKPAKLESESDEEYLSESEKSSEVETPPEEDNDEPSPKIKEKKITRKGVSFSSKKVRGAKGHNSMSTSVVSKAAPSETSQAVSHIEAANREWLHLSFSFLWPKNIRDSANRKMFLADGELNPQYDPSTLYVPADFLNRQTPAMRQWWQFKSANFDTLLFFKMGKFYELFHMDAVIATKELQILFMRGEYAHAGFPEKSYKRYADVLIQKGYKVARIEQTETPAMMEQRVKATRGSTKFDKVVRREICRISSIGTRVISDIDSDAFLYTNSYLVAISYEQIDELTLAFGLCFVDVSIGKFHLSQFVDDQHYSKLRTLMSHFSPVELIHPASNKLSQFLNTAFPAVRKQTYKKFWTTSQTLKYVAERKLWEDLPELRSQLLDPSDVLEQSVLPQFQLAISSFGGIVQYLEEALIADDILSMGLFEVHTPPDSATAKLGNYLILDSITIKNLEILYNIGGEESGSLFKIINNCCTAFGKRLLRNWICLPLCNQREQLESRQNAVHELNENADIVPHLRSWCATLNKVPDLERLLAQIHSQSSLKRCKEHPDSRAIMFESETYRRRRINNLVNTLDGFETIVNLCAKIAEISSIKSPLLRTLVKLQSDGGDFPDLAEKIVFFRNSFDASKARKEGNIIPAKGVDAEYDEAIEKIDKVHLQLEEYLRQQMTYFKARISYVHAGKNRYQLELPEACVMKAIDCKTDKYELKSSRKGFKRYHTSKIIELVNELEKAEANRASVLGDIFRRLLERFDHDYRLWMRAVECVAHLDAVISLAKTKQIFECNGASSCLPQIEWNLSNSEPVQLYAENLRNACLIEIRELIPNTVHLSGGTLVLTGPNMAGKTTLMRSVGLMTVLAQMGAYVPASQCRLSPVDRIFTRIGAYDQVIESQSTFMLELSETVTLVRHSTRHSLVLIDELGRGTSTFDGIAIAHAVLEELAHSTRCRAIFSTHFHSIVDELDNSPNIQIGHMGYMVENENKADPTEEDVIFLYQLKDGVCSQSYGYNVAKMAGIPRNVLRQAYKAGHAFELQIESCRLLDNFVNAQRTGKSVDFADDKMDKLAQYLSEIVITRKG